MNRNSTPVLHRGAGYHALHLFKKALYLQEVLSCNKHISLTFEPSLYKQANANTAVATAGVYRTSLVNNLERAEREFQQWPREVEWQWERLLNRRNIKRIHSQLNMLNAASYRGLILKHGTPQENKEFSWEICKKLL